MLHGLEWGYFDFNQHLALGHGHFAIHFQPELKQYVLKHAGDILAYDISMSKLMGLVPEIILDQAANNIKPSWDNLSGN